MPYRPLSNTPPAYSACKRNKLNYIYFHCWFLPVDILFGSIVRYFLHGSFFPVPPSEFKPRQLRYRRKKYTLQVLMTFVKSVMIAS